MLAALLAAGLVALGLVTAGASAPESAVAAKRKPPKPNIVMIMTDDQPASTVTPEVMPNLFDLIIDPGTSFSDYIVTTPLCCPSRANLLTGQYGHNNGVLRNTYADLLEKRNVLPRWLQRGGYRTAHIGKFLNLYEKFVESPLDVAPGWNRWFTVLEKRMYYNWKASRNGKKLRYGEEDEDHLTEVTNRVAKRWTDRLVRKKAPFYLQMDTYAPHGAAGRDKSCAGGPAPSPQDERRFADVPLPTPPNFNEADVSDKPGFIQSRPLMDADSIKQTTRRYRCLIETMYGVDRGIRGLYKKIAKAGELDRTIFIFTSDNGYYSGEHRIPKGKPYAYEENIRMPLSMLVPEQYRSRAPVVNQVATPVANLDLAATITDLARVEPCRKDGQCRTLDGLSLMPLLDGSGGFPQDREFLIELEDCSYRGLRSDHQVYLEYGAAALSPNPATGACQPSEIEHYDLDTDPFQLQNLYPSPRRSDPAEFQRRAQQRMVDLTDCAGISGRDPAPASGHYCG